jgi:fimbrial chaperone protein
LSCLLAAAWLLFAAASAQAGEFQVLPIKVELGAGKAVSALTVRNEGNAPASVQIEVMAWEQSDGEDRYVPSRDLLVFPPIATIASGAAQVVRVGLRRAIDRERELSYRLFIQELPQPRPPGFRGLQVLLRLGIPVFVAPQAASNKLIWRAARAADGGLVVWAHNCGNAHAKIISFQVMQHNAAEPVARHTEMAYVLNGKRRTWTLPVAGKTLSAGSELRLQAELDGSVVDTELRLGTMEP